MTHTFAKIISALALATTAACGGAGTATPESFVRGPSLSGNFDTDTGVLTAGGREIGRVGDEIIEANGRARVTRNAASNSRVAQAGSGNAYALSYATYNGVALSGAVYGRADVPDLPGGTATFTGDYAGVVTGNTGTSAQRISSLTLGDAQLSVDFNNETVSGSITNRQVRAANGGAFGASTGAANIRLNQATMTDDGLYGGSTSFGQFTQSGRTYRAINGSYSGLLAGSNATEGAGALSFTHVQNNGDRYTEQGSFAVTR